MKTILFFLLTTTLAAMSYSEPLERLLKFSEITSKEFQVYYVKEFADVQMLNTLKVDTNLDVLLDIEGERGFQCWVGIEVDGNYIKLYD